MVALEKQSEWDVGESTPSETAHSEQAQETQHDSLGEHQAPVVMPWVLKILSGPHLGAEINIGLHDYGLGKGEDNDIILADESLERQHCRLEGSEQGIYLHWLAQEARLYIQGVPVSQQEIELKPFEVVSSGQLNFVYGPANQDWPQISIPELQPDPEPEKETDEGARRQETTPEESNLVAALQPPRARKGGWLIAAAVFMGLGGAAYKWVPWGSETQIIQPSAPVMSKADKLNQALQDAGLGQITATENDNQIMLLEGYVADNGQQLQLQSLLNRHPGRVKNEVQNNAQLFSNIGYLLNVLYSPHLKVVHGKQLGEFKITGYLEDKLRWPELEARLTRDMVGIKKLEAAFDTLESRAKWLQQQFKGTELSLLQLQKESGVILVNGEIPAGALELWQKIKNEFDARYAGMPALKFAAARHEQVFRSIKGVSLGGTPYVITTEGDRVTIGGRINGYVVESIDLDRVTLSKAGYAVNYYLGGKNDH